MNVRAYMKLMTIFNSSRTHIGVRCVCLDNVINSEGFNPAAIRAVKTDCVALIAEDRHRVDDDLA